MPKLNPFRSRYAVLFYFIIWFLILSQILRITFFIWQYDEVSWNILNLFRTLFTGLFFDIGTITFVSLTAILYYTVMPNKWIGSYLDRILVYFFTTLTVFILVFTFFAELTFWDEFKTRFNFIAVDYLIYTHEVVANIEQSYPIPVLVGGVFLLTIAFIYIFYERKAFTNTFTTKASAKTRLSVLSCAVAIALFFGFFIRNYQAEWSSNRYNSEISKSGIYSFFAAFRNNQMKYVDFYTSIDNDKAFGIIKEKLKDPNARYHSMGYSIHRTITDSTASGEKKNVVFVLVESLSGSFLKEFGNKENITPFMDSLAQKSMFFNDLYATGTRTVRGMEAVTLCIPPTPGQSIVKRPENQNLYTVCSVFKSKAYDCNFFYGGDGYFDNMNAYFGGNGFTIYDRGRGSVLSDKIKTTRHNIDDSEVTFENAWGICDEDIFNKMLSVADAQYKNNKPFFNFVMTTSNHRPFTYPSGKIDIPSGTSREGAVKYTDFALRELFKKASQKPWFKNTVFVVIADHCASSAGKDEIDVANYHIPVFIVNLPEQYNQKISKQCSQIDLWPTLFSIFKWNYESDFFGKNVLDPKFEERALMGTYRKLVLMKKEKVMILSDQKKQAFYTWNRQDNSLKSIPMNQPFLDETISWYQTADYLFTNKLLK
ncbi:sulfatase-like hydrolase/transferase [Flavobacterium sp. ANB]|uniref:LTA synthase family protein n=1 Tax=unclassified Flavobacterium TaxID=196869 RepID=UPI0012B97006|nr:MULTISPECIES: alkaline phosphatase family protein [unclassified Flavobacterium]MBF4516117.1 sulfatase-like hydrolase/transferase [Flavobacterium sp. ANB]MTD72214.1 sulfatase-like hydrolase/transferase [Flavobacterium sp. LC2016-13]